MMRKYIPWKIYSSFYNIETSDPRKIVRKLEVKIINFIIKMTFE